MSKSPRAFRSRARKLMEKHVGRKLEIWEEVHHKDENLENFNIDNLEILDKVTHIKLHAARRPKIYCSVPNCGQLQKGKGLCRFHYQRQRYGLPLDAEYNCLWLRRPRAKA